MQMKVNRLEAFSDGVLAIIITIMVLELKVPHGSDLAAIAPLLPVFLSYVLSFIYVGIYWNNHHHMMLATRRVKGTILWANLHLLFWLSLIPFTTGWMGENHFENLPTALYGFNLLMAALAYALLQTTILKDDKNSLLAQALIKDIKGKISPALYLFAIFVAFYNQWISQFLYALVAIMWIVPDKRIEKEIEKTEN